MEPLADDKWPTGLADYRPIEVVDKGRMSTVIRAVEGEGGREVAIKLLHDHLADEKPVRRRLRREFAAVRRLDHPAIVAVEDIVDDGDTLALVMEYVDGRSVRQTIEADGPMDWTEVKPLVDDILAGLEHAHHQGIWHRDLSAEHVLVDRQNRARIIGFGLARVDELVGLTMHTRVLGALEAMAPERVLGMDYDGRADLYSVGAVAHEMLFGHPPTDGTMKSAFARGAESDGETSFPEGIADEARYLLERSLVGDMSARFATAGQMRRTLDGNYDRRLWQRWVSRVTKTCPACDAPVIAGIDRCVECGYEYRRLVRNPGGGRWIVRIISPREAFEADVWFEKNSEPEHLSMAQFDALRELLESHEDTKRVVDWSLAYRFPPYVLFNGLDADDATRIAELLEKRGIPHQLEETASTRWQRGKRWLYRWLRVEHRENELKKVEERRERPVPEGVRKARAVFISLCTTPLRLLTKIDARFLGFLFVLSLFGQILWGLKALYGLDPVWFAPLMALFVASVVVFRTGAGWARQRFRLNRDRPEIFGQALMIPSGLLERIHVPETDIELPRRTGRVLAGIDDESVRCEVHELIVLAVAVARRSVDVDADLLSVTVDEILDIGQCLDDAVTERAKNDTAELYAAVERLELQLEETRDGERRELITRRDELLDELDARDRAVHEITVLRTQLQRARGRLFDAMSDAETTTAFDDEIVLSFDDPETRLDEIEDEVEARKEVEELTS